MLHRPGTVVTSANNHETEESVLCPAPARRFSLQYTRLIVSLFLIALVLVLYEPVQDFQFLSYDDPSYITQNAAVLTGLNARSIGWAFTAVDAFYWHPLAWLSHMLD